MSAIGFVGVGELALYTIRGLRRGGYREPILLSPRNNDKAGLLQRDYGCKIMGDNQAVVDAAQRIVIATRPQHCLQALAELDFHAGQTLISVVAGIDIETLRGALPRDLEVVRAMPVSSAECGASPTLVFPAHDTVCELFDHCGTAITVDDEKYFDQGSILACVYIWFFALYGELIESTRGPNLPYELSAELVMGMAEGAARLALYKRDQHPAEIAAAIATEGTYSKLGLDLMREHDAFAPWNDACRLLAQKLSAAD